MQLKRYSSIPAILLALVLFMPQTASAQSFSAEPSLSDGSPAITVEGPLAEYRGGGITITQNANTEDITSGGVRCAGNAPAMYTTENSFYRVFDLSAYPEITGNFTVNNVNVGINISLFPNSIPTQEGFVRLYNLTSPPVDGIIAAGDLELMTEMSFDIEGFPGPKTTGYIESVDIEGTFSNDQLLAVEMFLPTGNPEDTGLEDEFGMAQGENDDGETDPVYLASASCGITDPTEIENLAPGAMSGWVVTVTGMLSTANEDGAVAQRVTLGQNFPNPVVSGRTDIPFSLESAQDVRVTVFDALGREVAASAATFSAGEQSVEIDTNALPNGVYFYRVNAGETTQTRKMVVMQ